MGIFLTNNNDMNMEHLFNTHKKLIIVGILIVLLFWFWSSWRDSDADSSGPVAMSVAECEEAQMADLNQALADPNSESYQAIAHCVEQLHQTVTVKSLKCTACRIVLRNGRSHVSDFEKDVAVMSFVVVASWDGYIHKDGSTAVQMDVNLITEGAGIQVLRSSALITVTEEDLKKMAKWLLGAALKVFI